MQLIYPISLNRRVESLRFDRHGQRLLVHSTDNEHDYISLWSLGESALQLFTIEIEDMNQAQASRIKPIKKKGSIQDICLHPRRDCFAVCRWKADLELRSTLDGAVLELKDEIIGRDAVTFSSTGESILISAHSPTEQSPPATHVYDTSSWRLMAKTWNASTFARHPGGDLIALNCSDQGGADIRFLDLKNDVKGLDLQFVVPGHASRLAFNPTGEYLAIKTSGLQSGIYVRSLLSTESILCKNWQRGDSRRSGYRETDNAAFTASGANLFLSGWGSARGAKGLAEINAMTGALVHDWFGDGNSVSAFEVSWERSFIAIGHVNGDINIWMLDDSLLPGKDASGVLQEFLSTRKKIDPTMEGRRAFQSVSL